MDNFLNVKTKNGQNIDINVLDIIELNDDKKYILYSLLDTDDIYISILNEKHNTYNLEDINNEEEYNNIINYLYKVNQENI